MTSIGDLLEEKKEWKVSEYSVYKYIPNQETINRDGAEPRAAGQGFSLILVGTSISTDREPFLREHVGTKITHSSLYRSNGQVTTLDPELFPPSSQSYHCLVEVSPDENNSKNEEEILYLLSFMSIGKQGLDLFRTELDKYCKSLHPLLRELPPSNPSESFPGSNLEIRVKNWFSENVEYLSRVVQRCQKELPLLLHTAVEPYVEVAGDDLGAIKDINEFLEACSLANLMQFSSESSPVDQSFVKITVTKDDCQVTGGESSKFTDNWAQVLLAQGTASPDPFFIRQAIENYKLKIIQDLNALKRLLRQAETDYHSLFRCFVFMVSCSNGPLLLRCALQEAQTLSSPDTMAVLEAIKLYTDKHGFQNNLTT
ncbi:protein Njmu-R1-like [Halichondria panicea]|uniref:protein Njmu-R1-like n=1 Tax=Halichondria panicea TaxID=6063 RepID=UPI00312B39B7